MKSLTELAEAIVEILATATGRLNAVTAVAIANRLDMPSRRVREIISNEFEAISAALPAPLISIPPHGYWLSTDAEDLRARQAWLLANRDGYDIQIEAHEAMCKRHGLAGVLSTQSPATKPKKRKP